MISRRYLLTRRAFAYDAILRLLTLNMLALLMRALHVYDFRFQSIMVPPQATPSVMPA